MFSRMPQTNPLPEDGAAVADTSQAAGTYMYTLQMLERLHRLMLDLIKDEFERLGRTELTPIQALILYNLGEDVVSAGELRSRGMYQGSNVSYNLKKLVSMGYIHNERCDTDRRSIRVRLTEQGLAMREVVHNLFINHATVLAVSGILHDPPLDKVNLQLRRIERFWLDQIRYIY